MSDVLNRIAELGVVPVVAIDAADHALPLADALLTGGLPVVEITFRTRPQLKPYASFRMSVQT